MQGTVFTEESVCKEGVTETSCPGKMPGLSQYLTSCILYKDAHLYKRDFIIFILNKIHNRADYPLMSGTLLAWRQPAFFVKDRRQWLNDTGREGRSVNNKPGRLRPMEIKPPGDEYLLTRWKRAKLLPWVPAGWMRAERAFHPTWREEKWLGTDAEIRR